MVTISWSKEKIKANKSSGFKGITIAGLLTIYIDYNVYDNHLTFF
jgi:hypothetical protein